nr:immunoglobulin heavy chain junction region [Macaca mulatta]MOW47113.1 immunoglobulin heavy chain junction region [Macaca mulatta]MOW47851.1 immunoglobulin heavy chain junction region [Macaca mulatta]MOW48057.1 immunoglobulin heavy chain junction region [Macaca mulatta]MOW48100.1 immunoglobulin heavy chain junction region [Macaca mulatta]
CATDSLGRGIDHW